MKSTKLWFPMPFFSRKNIPITHICFTKADKVFVTVSQQSRLQGKPTKQMMNILNVLIKTQKIHLLLCKRYANKHTMWNCLFNMDSLAVRIKTCCHAQKTGHSAFNSQTFVSSWLTLMDSQFHANQALSCKTVLPSSAMHTSNVQSTIAYYGDISAMANGIVQVVMMNQEYLAVKTTETALLCSNVISLSCVSTCWMCVILSQIVHLVMMNLHVTSKAHTVWKDVPVYTMLLNATMFCVTSQLVLFHLFLSTLFTAGQTCQQTSCWTQMPSE